MSRTDFDKTSELFSGGSPSRAWKVCEDYELKKSVAAPECDSDTGRFFVVPKYSSEPPYFDKWRSYEPLEDTPDLFLKFARLHWADDQDEAMLGWIRSYGTLGHGQPPWAPGSPQDVKEFREAVGQAAGVLALYEAALNDDKEKAKATVLREIPFVGFWWRLYNSLPDIPENMDQDFVASGIADTVEDIYDGDYLRYGLSIAVEEVEYMVRNYCSSALRLEEGSRDPSEITANWYFMSLLGAMYLQMYWLMAAGSTIARCEHCGLLISLARPTPAGRKRRRDRRFCDDACRQAHHRSKERSADSSS